jgi:hypothetical protein
MGVYLYRFHETNDFGCNKCCICDSIAEKNQKLSNGENMNSINNNDRNTNEANEKINILPLEYTEKIYQKNKLKKLFYDNHNHISSFTNNSSKQDAFTSKIIQIQANVRGYLQRKKNLHQKIIFNKLNNIKSEKEKNSENENIDIDIEDNLVLSLSINGTIFTGDNSCKSSMSNNSRFIKINTIRDMSRFAINKKILPFNLKSKNNIKYKYFGFLKNKNKQNYISTSGMVKNSCINDTKIVKNGYGKLVFDDKSIFKCHFTENRANGIGRYIDHVNNEEFIGEYRNNCPNGFGIYRSISTERNCSGTFKKNGLCGIGIEESVEDGYIYFGEFDKNQKHGYGLIHWKDGITYEGQFFRNQMNGYAIIKYPQNRIYKGNMNKGKMEGFGEFIFSQEKKYVGYYKNDKRNGFGIFLWKIPKEVKDLENIKAYIGFWEDGHMNGLGLKIIDGKMKYGVWQTGSKVEWIEEDNIKNFIFNNQKKYLSIIEGKKNIIFKLIKTCSMANDIDIMEQEYEFN